MTLSVARLRHYLQESQFEKLFVEELGWDRNSAKLSVEVDGRTCLLQGLAQKRGVQILLCETDSEGRMPDYGTRRKIEKQVTKSAYEHLIIFVDGARAVQIWQWVAREPGQPAKYREHAFHPKHQAGESLVQKLQTICFPLSEEEAIDLTGTVLKLRDAFDRDRVTKKFYERFKKEHGEFLQFISGISETADREWYASLMLNRLMFVYFIQQKAFLDGDKHYLQNRLRMVQEQKGKGKFYTFYRYFLLRLFHEGFAQQPAQRAPDLEALLGKIPYLNGGLFDVHQLEQKYPKTDIPDEAFEGLFAFFDQYEWHLDTRPLRNDREINPDVLGYIFEKFVNQKQMGAYYTKEDITEYISKNTIIPFLFDSARKKCAIAFEPGSALWQLLPNDPDRYIYEPVRRGVIDGKGEVIPELALPEFVQKGMNDPKARMFEKKYNLGEADLQTEEGRKLTLPTETWREYVNRRKRCLELREKLENGEIYETNDLITYNLNIRQLAEDAINTCEGPKLLRAFYSAISSITVLDPTCGSGAFLFAALNILEPLYEACLVRMEAFLEDLEHSGERHRPEKFSDFKRILAEIDKHPNRRYFILKSIIINNLYGVDIMEEAVEICKLRLFLKLVAQVDKVKDLEPLPDIDFNIRPGNTLVGFARLQDVQRTLDGKLGFKKDQVDRITEDAEIVDKAYRRFHEMQTTYDMDARDFAGAKQELRSRLANLTEQLDRYLATDYGVSESIILKKKEYQDAFRKWRTSHQPFHWFAEFYAIMNKGGFQTIIGNPPYVEWPKIKDYTVNKAKYTTLDCGNIYSTICERSYALFPPKARFGMIVPISCVATLRMKSLRDVWKKIKIMTWASYYSGDAHPSVLFNGVKFRLAILLQSTSDTSEIFSTHFQRWYAEGREFVFPSIEYVKAEENIIRNGLVPKVGSSMHSSVLSKLCSLKPKLALNIRNAAQDEVYCHRIVAHFVKALDFIPYFRSDREGKKKSEDYKVFPVANAEFRGVLTSLLNSNLFYSWFVTYSDVYHCGREIITDFPCDLSAFEKPITDNLQGLSEKLMGDYRKNAIRRKVPYRATGLVSYDEFYPRKSKSVIDEIDVALAPHYGLTDDELDFFINYDIKYRMGQDGGEDEEGK